MGSSAYACDTRHCHCRPLTPRAAAGTAGRHWPRADPWVQTGMVPGTLRHLMASISLPAAREGCQALFHRSVQRLAGNALRVLIK